MIILQFKAFLFSFPKLDKTMSLTLLFPSCLLPAANDDDHMSEKDGCSSLAANLFEQLERDEKRRGHLILPAWYPLDSLLMMVLLLLMGRPLFAFLSIFTFFRSLFSTEQMQKLIGTHDRQAESIALGFLFYSLNLLFETYQILQQRTTTYLHFKLNSRILLFYFLLLPASFSWYKRETRN